MNYKEKPILWFADRSQARQLFDRFKSNGIAWKLHRGFDTANIYRKLQAANGPTWVHCFYMEKTADGWMVQVIDGLYIDVLFDFDLVYYRDEWRSRYESDLFTTKPPRL